MADRVIRIILEGSSGSVVRSFAVAGAAAEAAEGKFSKLKKAGTALSSVGSVMTRLAAPAVALGAVAVKSAATYEQAMTRIRTQTGASAAEATKQASNFSKLAGQVGFSSTQMAQGLYPIESEGLRGAKATQALTAAMKGAKIGGDSLTVTADAMAGVLGTGAKDIHSANEAMMVMDKTVGLGKMQLSDLTAAMGTGVVSEATKMGLGFRDVGAALASMTRQGVPAEQEASRLRLTLTKMAAPTGAALKQTLALRLGQYQLASDLRKPNGLVTALGDLRTHLTGLSENQQNQALANMFGQSRGLGNITGLLRALPTMTSIRNQLTSATGGQFANRWKEQLETPAQKFANAVAAAKTSVTNLGVALMPIVLSVLPKLTSGVTGFVGWITKMPKPVRDVVVGFTAFLAIGGPILMIVGKMITAIATIKDAMEALKITTLVTSDAMKASLIGLGIFALVELVTHFKQVKQIGGEALNGLGIMATAVGHVFGKVADAIIWPFKQAFAFIKRGVHSITSIPGNFAHGASSFLRSASFGLLHTGGPVRTHFDTGGPVGTDTIPGWLTPGEFVLNRATTARVGVPALSRLNDGASLGGGDVQITPQPMSIYLDSRLIWRGLMQYRSSRAARGTAPVGGGMMTGAAA